MDKYSVGADPEFSCYQNNEYIRTTVLYPRISTNGEQLSKLMFGRDGMDATGEIRPAPTYDAELFTNNIRKCLALGYRIIAYNLEKQKLSRAREKYDAESAEENKDKIMAESKIELKAGSFWKYPLGGHIHIGTSKHAKTFPEEMEECFLKPHQKREISSSYIRNKTQFRYRYFIINALDASIGLGLKLVESWDRGKARMHGGSYGHFSQHNNQNWGIEYRTPPSWIISPDMCKAIFELTQLSVYNIVENTEAITQLLAGLNLIDTEPSGKSWQFSYENKTRTEFRDIFRDNWLKAVESFDKINETKFLDPLITLIQNKEEWNDELNLFESWKINKDTFAELEFTDPLEYYANNGESSTTCPECGSYNARIEDDELICGNCGYDEANPVNDELICLLEDGELECPACGSYDVELDGRFCLQCQEEDCRHHICDFFMG